MIRIVAASAPTSYRNASAAAWQTEVLDDPEHGVGLEPVRGWCTCRAELKISGVRPSAKAATRPRAQ